MLDATGKKSMFVVPTSKSEQEIYGIIYNWMQANGYSKQNAPEGINWWYMNDPMLKGKRSVEFYIQNGQVTFLAYLGTLDKPKNLEGFVGALPKQQFVNDLNVMFSALSGPAQQQPYIQPTDGQSVQQEYNQPVYSQTNQFAAQIEKKNSTMAIIAFVASILMLLLSFMGVVFGVIIDFVVIWLGIMGTKSKRKGLGIAAISITSVAILLNIVALVLSAV